MTSEKQILIRRLRFLAARLATVDEDRVVGVLPDSLLSVLVQARRAMISAAMALEDCDCGSDDLVAHLDS